MSDPSSSVLLPDTKLGLLFGCAMQNYNHGYVLLEKVSQN